MKNKIICLILSVLCLGAITSCDYAAVENYDEDKPTKSMFVVVETTTTWQIVYHKETKVMYAVSDCSYNFGNFTLLVDENGDPLLWKED
jgi:hypothetical protein